MLRLLHIVVLLFCSFAPGLIFAQGVLVSASPDRILPGEEREIIIRGMGTRFRQGQSTVDMGPGIHVVPNTIAVQSPEVLYVRIKADPTASATTHTITVQTGKETARLENIFNVIPPFPAFNASLTVLPVQHFTPSTFEPAYLKNATRLFTVNITNDNTVRNLSMVLTITPNSYQADPILTATKKLNNLQPGAALVIDNRQFDAYTTGNPNAEVYDASHKAQGLPGGQYTFNLKVFDAGNLLSSNNIAIWVDNTTNRPQLIFPGNAFSAEPQQLQSIQPLFQWYGQGTSYDIAIYPVYAHQANAEEVVLNRPVYKQSNITETHLLYPAGARPLEEGQTYAWQITMHAYGLPGVPGEIYWFRVMNTTPLQKPKKITDIKVEPEELNLETGQTFQFRFSALNDDQDTLPVKPRWKVIPADAGKINEDGKFIAGDKAYKIVAVIAQYAELTDYVTLIINKPQEQNNLPEPEKKP